MKILVVIGSYPPDHSGAGKRIRETYRAMQRHAREVYGLATVFDWRIMAPPTRLEAEVKDDGNVQRVLQTGFWGVFFTCLKSLIKQDADIVHCVGLSRITLAAAWAALLLGHKFVFELSIDPPAGLFGSLRGRILHYPLRKAAGYIALTPRLHDFFRDLSWTRPVFLRANPVTLGIPEDAPSHEGTVHLLLGRFTTRKGQSQALKTLALLPDTHRLILAGPVMGKSDEAYLAALKEEATSLGVEGRVSFQPAFIDDVAALIMQSDTVWCFSEREGLPNVVLEGLWCGRPAFVNASLGLSDLIVNGVNGQNLPDLPREKARMIAQEMKRGFDTDLIQRTARAYFDLDQHAAKTYAFLKKVSGADQ